jgi:hypothetical protein
MPTRTPTVSELSAQINEAFTKTRQVLIEATDAWVDYVLETVKLPSFDELPTAPELIDRAFEQAQKALSVQRSTLKGLAEAWPSA